MGERFHGRIHLQINYIHICAIPPSTNNSIPVIKLLSSDARNETTFATSSGVPIRPNGTLDIILVLTCSVSFSLGAKPLTNPLRPGVSIGPGLMALTRIFLCFSSFAQERVNDRTTALVAP